MQLAALPATAHTPEYVDLSISIRALQRCSDKAKRLGLHFDNVLPNGRGGYWFSLRKGVGLGTEVLICTKNGDGYEPDWQ